MVQLSIRIGFAVSVALLLAGCGRNAVVRPVLVEDGLVPSLSHATGGQLAGICADGDDVLVLEASGARILRFDSKLGQVETLSLTNRVVAPRGIAADQFYVYVFNDRTLFRLLKKDPLLRTWLHGVRTTGLAGFSPGEMLVSDAERGAVWLKTMFGDSRVFLAAADLVRPGQLAALPDGMFAALSGDNVIVRFNRAGIVSSRNTLPGQFDLMVADHLGSLYLALSGHPELVVVKTDGRSLRYRLLGVTDAPVPVGLAISTRGLVVLDRDARLLLYQLP